VRGIDMSSLFRATAARIFSVPHRGARETKGPWDGPTGVTSLSNAWTSAASRPRPTQSPPISNDPPAYTLRKVAMWRPVQRITSVSRCLNSADPRLNA